MIAARSTRFESRACIGSTEQRTSRDDGLSTGTMATADEPAAAVANRSPAALSATVCRPVAALSATGMLPTSSRTEISSEPVIEDSRGSLEVASGGVLAPPVPEPKAPASRRATVRRQIEFSS